MQDENNRCYTIEDDDGRQIGGYWRDKAKAEAEAVRLGGKAVELNPPDPIACEDDETQH